jgi:hypothetical protein
MAKTFGWEIPYYENRKVSKTRPAIEPGVVEMIKEYNRFDMELYEFAKERFEESLRKKAVTRTAFDRDRSPKPGPIKDFYYSTLSTSRFLMSKLASAI